MEKSFISKGYIAHLGSLKEFELGSTYEREFTDEKPCMETAQNLLREKLHTYAKEATILDCKAAVRVAVQGQYTPLVEKIAENTHVFTGLGSRGLLYHGLFGRALSQAILSKNAMMS